MADSQDQLLLPHEIPLPDSRSVSRQLSITSSTSSFSSSTTVTLSGPISVSVMNILRHILPVTDSIVASSDASTSPTDDSATIVTDLRQVDDTIKALQATDKPYIHQNVPLSDLGQTTKLETESIDAHHLQDLSSWARHGLESWHGRLILILDSSNLLLDCGKGRDQDDIELFLHSPNIELFQNARSPKWLGEGLMVIRCGMMTDLEVLEEIVDRVVQRLSGLDS
jgi:hypothetical protein